MASLKKRSHLVVALSVVVVGLLAAWGLIGENPQPEKIEQLQVVVSGAGEAGVRITETIDQDFGTTDRRGPQLVVPNDFGVPTNITASSASAPDDLQVAPAPFDSPVQGTRIRVGDPDVTLRGQHRYTISYVLPNARFAAPTFSLDAVGGASEFPIENVSVVFSGISLDSPRCTFGGEGSDEPCPFERGAPLRLEVERLDPFEGITVSGEVTQWTAGEAIEPPARPDQREDRRGVTALATMVLGAVTAGAVFGWARRTGANEVVGSSPEEAAHGVAVPSTATRKVSDAELAEMSTIEFAPPKGIAPWQGAVVLTEELDSASVTAWFSGAIADDVLAIERHDNAPRLSRGPAADKADPTTQKILNAMFGDRQVVDLDGYDSKFATAWHKVEELQDTWVKESGWWWSGTPNRGIGKPGGCASLAVLMIVLVPLLVFSAFILGLFGVLGGVVTAVLVGAGLPAIVSRVAYAPLLPGRTASGSAYALQVESFRRFLVDSEAQYVDWAWKNGLLRQYSAWAVALGAADAWQRAMENAGVPEAEVTASSPLLVYSMASSFNSSHVEPAPVSSGGSSSGGFSSGGSSGSVGGGGGGGSHGSW